MKINLFYTTCSKSKSSKELAIKLLKEKKVICVNIISNVKSYYKENESIKSTDETILIIKTFLTRLKLEKLVKKIHIYDIPFIAKIQIDEVNAEYLKWAKKNL